MKSSLQIITVWTLAVFGLYACGHASRQHTTETQTDVVPATTIATEAHADTIVQHLDSYPDDSSFAAKVLTVGVFHSDEVWDNAAQGKWWGLFKNEKGFYMAETRLKTKRVHDEIVDEQESEQTGWEVRTDNRDTSILLVEGSNFLQARAVQQAALSKEHILPGDTLKIDYLGVEYHIYASGEQGNTEDNADAFAISNYQLFISAIIKGQLHKSLLVAQPDFDDQMIRLIFAGDMDGDGMLDIILDTSRHYNVSRPTLYLSKPAMQGNLVQPIGAHTSVGC